MVKVLLFYFLVCSVCWILVAIIHITENVKNNSNLDTNDNGKDIKESEPTLADKIKNETDIHYRKEINRKYQKVMDDIREKSNKGLYKLTYNAANRKEWWDFVTENKELFTDNGFHVVNSGFNMNDVTISWR